MQRNRLDLDSYAVEASHGHKEECNEEDCEQKEWI
jgi:hypothetical protein